jgi:thioredoxin 1
MSQQSMIESLDLASFSERVEHFDGYALVDFWAPWCGPCHALAPSIEAVSEKFATRLRVGKVNVDAAPELAEKFNIRGIPTLVLLKGGLPVSKVVGVHPRDEIVQWIDQYLTKETH